MCRTIIRVIQCVPYNVCTMCAGGAIQNIYDLKILYYNIPELLPLFGRIKATLLILSITVLYHRCAPSYV